MCLDLSVFLMTLLRISQYTGQGLETGQSARTISKLVKASESVSSYDQSSRLDIIFINGFDRSASLIFFLDQCSALSVIEDVPVSRSSIEFICALSSNSG